MLRGLKAMSWFISPNKFFPTEMLIDAWRSFPESFSNHFHWMPRRSWIMELSLASRIAALFFSQSLMQWVIPLNIHPRSS